MPWRSSAHLPEHRRGDHRLARLALRRATRPITFTAAWALVAFAFTYPSLQPWYALWGGVLLGAVVLSARASDWVVTLTGCLLITSVLLDYAGWPIPVVQTIAVAVAWPLLRVVERARLGASAT